MGRIGTGRHNGTGFLPAIYDWRGRRLYQEGEVRERHRGIKASRHKGKGQGPGTKAQGKRQKGRAKEKLRDRH